MICTSAELAEHGDGIRFAIVRDGRTLPAFAVRFHGKVRAYVNECRHQASELDWEPGEFFDADKLYLVCATHGAMYAPDSGVCIAGPCGGARLASIAVEERDDKIFCIGD